MTRGSAGRGPAGHAVPPNAPGPCVAPADAAPDQGRTVPAAMSVASDSDSKASSSARATTVCGLDPVATSITSPLGRGSFYQTAGHATGSGTRSCPSSSRTVRAANRHILGCPGDVRWDAATDLQEGTIALALAPTHHQPCRLAHLSRSVDMRTMHSNAVASATGWVASLTMRFMPRTDDTAVTGRVTAAITARRSAAMVSSVFVRA